MTNSNRLIKREDGSYLVEYMGKSVGEFELDVDGFYKYWPSFKNSSGYLDEEFLGFIYTSLRDLNLSWNTIVDNYFDGRDND